MLLPIEHNEKSSLTNRASQTGETKNLAWSSGLRNGDSLGWRLKQLLILQHVISKRWKGSKCEENFNENIFTTHYDSPAGSSVVPPDCKKKEIPAPQPDRESIQKIQQVRGPRWKWSTQMHAWGNLCGRVSLLKCLWFLISSNRKPWGSWASEWEHEREASGLKVTV